MKKLLFISLRAEVNQIFITNDLFACVGGVGGFGGVSGGFGRRFYFAKGAGGGDWTWFMIGGFTIIALFLFLILYYVARVYFIHRQSAKSEQVLGQISNQDSFWNKEQMESYAFDLFHKIQSAWEKRDFDMVKSDLTPEFAELYMGMLNEMKVKKQINVLRRIHISEVRIISCEDCLEDNLDRYIAYISGTMLDYTINEETEEVVKNRDREIEEFDDTFHFIRQKDKWLLENINNYVGSGDILRAPNYTEKASSLV